MTENAKTITFVVVGLVAVAIGLITRPSSAELDEQSLVNQNLTKNFDSADEAKRLKIVRFDEDTATLREFEVAERDGLWTIPSKDGYPADAARQMAEAATSLMDRNVLHVASMSAGDHEEFGVIDPLSPKLEVGQKGVGTHVTMYDVHESPLADLVIGKAVKDADAQRYVREAGRDIVYVIEIDPAKLSTNFEDWIEKDLLKLNSWDLQQVQVKDYSAELTPVMTQQGLRFQLAGDMRSDMTLAYNDSDAKWSAEKLRQFDTQTESYVDFTLAEDEELNAESLNGLKTALDDLQIVDVVRKPQGLSNDLKAGEDFLKNEEALRDLVSKGFTPTRGPTGSGADEIISSNGEVIATMKNGTEYVLRFGNLTNVGAGDNANEQAVSTEAGGDKDAVVKSEGDDVHRYLFVMARFNEGAVKKPELQELPELPSKEEQPAAGEPAPATTDGDGDPATATENENGAASDSASTDEGATEPATVASSKSADEQASSATDANVADGAPQEEATAESDSDSTTNDPSTDQLEATAETAKTEATNGDAKDTASESQEPKADAASTETDKTKELEKLVEERKRIEQDNTRKEDDHQQTLEKGRENVKELNLRFGDWYFVVADDVFKKIRLGRESVVKKKDKKEDAAKTDSAGEATEATPPSGTIPGLPPIPGAEP
jgi:hypothetical protein